MKDQFEMKKSCLWLALAGLLSVSQAPAISLDNIQLWTGSGTNRAALVVEWNVPIVLNQTTVHAPIATKTLVWGYRFNGTATATEMFNAIAASDPRFYTVENIDPIYGTGVDAIGYNLDGTGRAGITDGTTTDGSGTLTNGVLIDPNLNVDASRPLNSGDLFWSGHDGPYWQLWNEENDSGGFTNSPNRGSSPYMDPNLFAQGEWSSAFSGLDGLELVDGSWIGFSVSADGYPLDPTDPNYANDISIFNNDEQAPPSPDGTYTAYVRNTNDFATQIISTNFLYPSEPYNEPGAVLGRPTLKFVDSFDLGFTVTDRVTIVDDPFNVTPSGKDVITEISSNGEITVQLGRPIYDDPNNPYGIDFILYGNTFFSAHNISAPVSDATDFNSATLSSGIFGHPTIVSVSQDGVNWYTYNATSVLFPEEAYRWDATNDSWTDEEMNPTKPLNPFIYTNNFASQTVANGLAQFVGAAGGTGYDLKASGLPWIQYVRFQSLTNAGAYTVIDAVAAVDPVTIGDALSIAPDNLAAGITNLVFQKSSDRSQTLIGLHFDSINAVARVNTVGLSDLSSFAPLEGVVSAAYQVQVKPVVGTGTVSYVTDIALRAADQYAGNGNDLKVFQWSNTNWIAQPFTYNAAANAVQVSGVTNLSAFVVAQIIPPHLQIQAMANGVAFQFVPVPNCLETLQRSTDLVHWNMVSTFTATNAQVMTLQDTNAPAANAFYRILLNP